MSQPEKHEEVPTGDYENVGTEVAAVLASARKAAQDMRAQAKEYADSLIIAAKQEAQEVVGVAQSESAAILKAAHDQSAAEIVRTRREVLAILETAQDRLAETERRIAEAQGRCDELKAAEGVLENRISDVVTAMEAKLAAIRSRRAEHDTSDGADGSSSIEELLAAGATALLQAEEHAAVEHHDN